MFSLYEELALDIGPKANSIFDHLIGSSLLYSQLHLAIELCGGRLVIRPAASPQMPFHLAAFGGVMSVVTTCSNRNGVTLAVRRGGSLTNQL